MTFAKLFVQRALAKQRHDASLLAVQGGAFDLEQIKTNIQASYGKVFGNLAGLVSLYGSASKWNASSISQILAFTNLKNSNLIATNTYKATSTLFSLRDALLSAYLTIFIMGITIAFDLGGFSDMKGVAALAIDVSQTPITQFAALENHFTLIKNFVNAVSVRNAVLAAELGNEIKSIATPTFSSLIPVIIARYVAASKAQGGSGEFKADVGEFLGKLVGVYKPVIDGNIDDLIELASQPSL